MGNVELVKLVLQSLRIFFIGDVIFSNLELYLIIIDLRCLGIYVICVIVMKGNAVLLQELDSSN